MLARVSSLSKKHWERLGCRGGHGLILSIPALRSGKSLAVGEYMDLIPMIDWCREVGFDLLQLLPINDSGMDKSPYSALSAFALHPLYLTLPSPESGREKALYGEISRMKRGKYFDYKKVALAKESYTRLYYKRGGKNFALEEFIDQQPWVVGYALFKALKVLRGYSSWQEWGEKSLFPLKLSKIPTFAFDEFSFQCFQQKLCLQQMGAVKRYAEKRGLLIKGDIPILLSKESADVWMHEKAFLHDCSVGAPPDCYSPTGQSWGFPAYNWSGEGPFLKKWWKWRLRHAENFFDLYRIDHVVGLFRLWTIPEGKKAPDGHFVPGKREKWMAQGVELLTHFLASSKMLPVAEDLGRVPKEIKSAIRRLGIPGTKVLRWERGEKGALIDPKSYPQMSMSTLSTHDSECSTRWWEERPAEARAVADFFGWHYKIPLAKEQLFEMLSACHNSHSLFHINLLQEFFPLVDRFSWRGKRGDRINVPGMVGRHNWLYRYRPTIEEIAKNDTFADAVRKILNGQSAV